MTMFSSYKISCRIYILYYQIFSVFVLVISISHLSGVTVHDGPGISQACIICFSRSIYSRGIISL